MTRSLRLLLVGGPMYDPLYQRIEQFTRSENVSVEIVARLPHPQLNDRLEQEFASGEAHYDLISTHTKYAPSQRAWLSSLNAEAAELELEQFLPQALELARFEGELLGIPRNLDVKLLLYRSDKLSSPPLTWEALSERASSLTARPELYGFVFPGRGSGLFGHFFELIAMAGGRMFPDPAVPRPKVDTPEGRWALELLRMLYRETAPLEALSWHYDQVTACFLAGRAAMTTDWPGSFYAYLDPQLSQVARYVEIALYPRGRAGRFMYSSSHTFAIPRTVQDRPAAISLLRYLTSSESQGFEARLGSLPARRDALLVVRKEASEGSLMAKRWELLDQALQGLLFPPRHPRYPKVERVIWQWVQRGIQGVVSVEEVLKAIEQDGAHAAEDWRGGV